MITATAQDFIKGALKDLGVLAAGEPIRSEDEDCLDSLNLLADALGVERLLLYKIVRTTKTLTATTASYTIGSGGSINIERPLWIGRAGLILDTSATYPTEIEIVVLNEDQYAEWPRKTEQSSSSRAIFYDYGFTSGLGTVYPLPIPNVGTTQLVLYTPGGHVSQFANLTTEYTFPTGWGRAIRKNLALELAPMYPAAVVSPDLRQQARSSKAAIKRANVRPVYRQNSPELSGGPGFFDIDAGRCR